VARRALPDLVGEAVELSGVEGLAAHREVEHGKPVALGDVQQL
jgi:hypothetical protein